MSLDAREEAAGAGSAGSLPLIDAAAEATRSRPAAGAEVSSPAAAAAGDEAAAGPALAAAVDGGGSSGTGGGGAAAAAAGNPMLWGEEFAGRWRVEKELRRVRVQVGRAPRAAQGSQVHWW